MRSKKLHVFRVVTRLPYRFAFLPRWNPLPCKMWIAIQPDGSSSAVHIPEGEKFESLIEYPLSPRFTAKVDSARDENRFVRLYPVERSAQKYRVQGPEFVCDMSVSGFQ